MERYKTQPLKIWNEAKEIRAKVFQEYVDAKKKGGLRVVSATGGSISFSTGLGEDVYIMGLEPLAGNTAWQAEFSLKCLEACEKVGWGREICGYSKNVWGAMMLNKFIMPDGTILDEWPVPDFITSTSLAPCHCKWIQYINEYKDVPCYLFDTPKMFPFNTEAMINYLSGQVLDFIKWAEDLTKRRFDDELFIKSVLNEFRSFRLWTKICELQKNIPAPLDEKSMYSLVVPNLTRCFKEETVSFYERLLEEVEERVEKGIAAVPTEQFRVITDAIPPWSFLQVWRYMEREYGCVSIGSPYIFILGGSWKLDEEGNLIPTPTPEEMGMRITNREEAVRALVWYKTHFATETVYTPAGGRVQHEVLQAVAKGWKIDGGILHLNRGCTMQALGGLESRRALWKIGIPAINFEGNDADPRDLDLTRTRRQIDIFLESYGVKRIT